VGGRRLKYAIAGLAAAGWLALTIGVHAGGGGGDAFPSEPLTIVVHSKPGSSVDLMARRAAEIAQRRCPVPVVVDNRPGTQGVAAMNHVLDAPRDGYTLLAVTRAFLSTLNVTRAGVSVDDFRWVARVTLDPEAIIVNAASATPTLAALIADAKARPESDPQIWIGPGIGGRDHLMAVRTWAALGIRARWIDYKSAPQSVLAMLRGEAAAYVGNASDIVGKDGLSIAALASPERSPALPDAPTFREQGFPVEAYMWRGFAYAEGVPDRAVRYAADLFAEVARDPEWREYVASTYATAIFDGPEAFDALVAEEDAETRSALEDAGLIARYVAEGPLPLGLAGLLFAALVVAGLLALARARRQRPPCGVFVAAGALWLSAFFAYQAALFRVPEANVTHPATLPWLWSAILGAASLRVTLRAWPRPDGDAGRDERADTRRGVLLVALVVAYVAATYLVGFLIATVPLVMVAVRLVGYRDGATALAVACLFVVAAHGVFELALGIGLPTGAWVG